MTDYLAEIAAMTVECPRCEGQGYWVRTGDDPEYPDLPVNHDCDHCKGIGRVLDLRFDGLRGECPGYAIEVGRIPNLNIRFTGEHAEKKCACQGTGYTINRDLAGLMEIGPGIFGRRICYKFEWGYMNNKWECDIGIPLISLEHWKSFSSALADTPLEAAAEALYEWLEQEKVTT